MGGVRFCGFGLWEKGCEGDIEGAHSSLVAIGRAQETMGFAKLVLLCS